MFLKKMTREVAKKGFDITTGVVGFLLALMINSALEHRKDRDTFDSMLKAVKLEATSNLSIINDSYDKYFESGVILKDFSGIVVAQSMSNPLFVKYLSDSDLELLNRYQIELRLANNYRSAVQQLDLSDTSDNTQWIDNIKNQWAPTTNKVYDDSKLIIAVK